MKSGSWDFLSKLLHTPSPSGFEADIQKVVSKYAGRFGDEVSSDVHGNLTAVVNPKGKIKVMLAGHCDQIGLMITHIDDQGFLWFNSIGGIDPSVLLSTRVLVLGREKKIPGVIGAKAVHLVPAHERGKPAELAKLCIDIGATNREEAQKNVRVGDPVVFAPEVVKLGKDRLTSAGLDDKVGVYVCFEALRIFAAQYRKVNSQVALYAVSTVQEEVGLRGARTSSYGIDPSIGIAVDVGHASCAPGVDAKHVGTFKLGKGPGISRGPNINLKLESLLVETAKKKRINYQPVPAPGITGTDANVIQVSRSGVATALVSIPNRYMHSYVEMVDLKDLDSAANLIAQTVLRITTRTNFIP